MAILIADAFTKPDGTVDITDGGGSFDPIAWEEQPSPNPRPLPAVRSRKLNSLQFNTTGASTTLPETGPLTEEGIIYTGTAVLAWVSIRETSGVFPAIVRIWDGLTAESEGLLYDASVPPGESREDVANKFFVNGLYLEIISGQVEISFGKAEPSPFSEGLFSLPVINYSVEARILEQGDGDSRVFLRARTTYDEVTGEATGYIAYSLGSELHLAVVVIDEVTDIAAPVPYVLGDRFGISVRGPLISLLRNGHTVRNVFDTTVVVGEWVGIYLENETVPWVVDDFMIKSVGSSVSHITYSDIDRRTWFAQPSFVRWRHRFRGHRESYKLNEEIGSFLFEVRQNYETRLDSQETLASNLSNLVNGVDLTPELDITIPGYNEIISRIDGLRGRIETLENNE